MTLSPQELSVLDRWQHGFPLTSRPFAHVAATEGLAEKEALHVFEKLANEGILSRVGAIVRPHTVGASVLAAMQVPPERLDEVAALVSAERCVNHNYERTHALNLWFVVAAPDESDVDGTIARIERATRLRVVRLPLLRAFHIGLGFPLADGNGERRAMPTRVASADSVAYVPSGVDRELLAAIEDGIPLTSRPYEAIGWLVGLDEREVIARLRILIEAGVIVRFGNVVRHRSLGYEANAMAVWDIAAERVEVAAAQFVRSPRVTLCYERPRRLPQWPYNLFCMVHAKIREDAARVIAELNAEAGTTADPQATLFSTRCFKQRGAVFSAPARTQ